MDFESLIQWKDPLKTGILMVVGLTLLISLSCMSLISVVAYAGLALLCCTTSVRLYHFLRNQSAVRGEKSPATPNTTSCSFNDYFEKELKLPRDRLVERARSLASELELYTIRIQRTLLIKDYYNTFLFLIVAYLLYVLGKCCNLLTLVTIGFVFLFTVPRIYRLYQKPLDDLYGKLRIKVDELYKKIQPALKNLPGKTN